MRISRLGWPTLALLVCCVAAAVAVSRASEKQPLSEPIQHDPAAIAIPGVLGDAPPLEAVVAEIMRLREQQGSDKLLESGVFEPLPLDSKITDKKLRLSANPASNRSSTDPAVCLVSSPWVSAEIADQTEALRNSAKALDETAHVLECNDRYSRADEIRALADQLRQDARTLREAHAHKAEPSKETPVFSFNGGFKR